MDEIEDEEGIGHRSFIKSFSIKMALCTSELKAMSSYDGNEYGFYQDNSNTKALIFL